MSYAENMQIFLRQSWHEFLYLSRRMLREIQRLPMPRLLALCMGVALVIAALPLAFTLFMLFMGLKLIAFAVGFGVRRQRRAPPQLGEHEQ